ncbi:MAG: twin-arginine translocation signal domain-containing protein [Planctomycetota bacterium]
MAKNLNRRSFLKKSMIATGAAGFMSERRANQRTG